jgi:hypothetical protein
VTNMGVVMKELHIKGDKGEMRLSVLFDSGASDPFIRSNVAMELSTPRKLPIPENLWRLMKKSCMQFLLRFNSRDEGKEIGIEAFLVDNCQFL